MLKCIETFLKYFIYDHHIVNIKTVQTIIVISNKNNTLYLAIKQIQVKLSIILKNKNYTFFLQSVQ